MAKYQPIEVPPVGEKGYSKRESDMLLAGVSRSQNFIGAHLDELDEIIYGDEQAPGLKTQAHSSPCKTLDENKRKVNDNARRICKNTKRIWYILGMLGAGGTATALTSPLWIPLIGG